jgi:hypothetical protein
MQLGTQPVGSHHSIDKISRSSIFYVGTAGVQTLIRSYGKTKSLNGEESHDSRKKRKDGQSKRRRNARVEKEEARNFRERPAFLTFFKL